MRNTILISLLLMFLPVSVSAQFYTITRDSELLQTERQKEAYKHVEKDVIEREKSKIMTKDTLIIGLDNQKKMENNSRNSDRKASLKTELQKKQMILLNQKIIFLNLPSPTFIKKSLETESYIPKSYWPRLFWKPDGFVLQYAKTSIIFSDLPIHVQENTMNSIIGQKVSRLTILKFNTNIMVVIICFGLKILGMRKIRNIL